MSRKVAFSPEALANLLNLYDYIASRGGAERALAYVGRIEHLCRSLENFPERGTKRDDLRPGLRVHGFERRAVIAYHVSADTVTILGILYGGRDADAALSLPEE